MPAARRRALPFLLPPLLFLGAMALLRLALFPGGKGAPPPAAPVASLLGEGGDDGGAFARVLGPRPLRFPEDHGSHPAFRHEWWYFTGNLDGGGGRRFGVQLTFFRFALAPPGGEGRSSSLAATEAWMAHLAVTDREGRAFRTAERFSRGAGGLAFAEASPGGAVEVRLDDWSLSSPAGSPFPARLRAFEGAFGAELDLSPSVPPVLQGDRGFSRKGEGEGNASLYYSVPRVAARGVVRSGGRDHAVSGEGWLDREWGTSALSPGQEGWDWFALRLSDGSDLMYYRLRRTGTGETEPFSAGSLRTADGRTVPLAAADVAVTATGRWRSGATGIEYPSGWDLSVPSRGLSLRVAPLLPEQEWGGAVRYWEGAVEVSGRGPAGPLEGRGYVELAGYGHGAPPPRR